MHVVKLEFKFFCKIVMRAVSLAKFPFRIYKNLLELMSKLQSDVVMKLRQM